MAWGSFGFNDLLSGCFLSDTCVGSDPEGVKGGEVIWFIGLSRGLPLGERWKVEELGVGSLEASGESSFEGTYARVSRCLFGVCA